jgi:hypothetical protein
MNNNLKLIEFTAAHGFRMTEQEFVWQPDEDENKFMSRYGFELDPSREGLDSQRDFREVRIFYAKGDNPTWFAIVDPSDGDRSMYVVVANAAELLELRLRLLPWHGLAVMQSFEALADLVEKAFTAWHGHRSMYPCADCDPEGHRREQEWRRKFEQRQAAEAAAKVSEGP